MRQIRHVRHRHHGRAAIGAVVSSAARITDLPKGVESLSALIASVFSDRARLVTDSYVHTVGGNHSGRTKKLYALKHLPAAVGGRGIPGVFRLIYRRVRDLDAPFDVLAKLMQDTVVDVNID